MKTMATQLLPMPTANYESLLFRHSHSINGTCRRSLLTSRFTCSSLSCVHYGPLKVRVNVRAKGDAICTVPGVERQNSIDPHFSASLSGKLALGLQQDGLHELRSPFSGAQIESPVSGTENPVPLSLGSSDFRSVLALGMASWIFVYPQDSFAVDFEAVRPAAEGLMAWAANEPANALSLPTWIIHVASVAEWLTAMALVWRYGDTRRNLAWKGLTWGMVPLLGGAMCACTWHFFYNDPSLEVLVVLQAFLTVVGNFTMWIAAYRIWEKSPKKAAED